MLPALQRPFGSVFSFGFGFEWLCFVVVPAQEAIKALKAVSECALYQLLPH